MYSVNQYLWVTISKTRGKLSPQRHFSQRVAIHPVHLGISAGVRWPSVQGSDYHLGFAGRQTHILSASLANGGIHSSAVMCRSHKAN